jgi:hypothetical protein
MPVLLTKPEDFDVWLDGSVNDAIASQTPNELLRIVATDKKSDRIPVEG